MSVQVHLTLDDAIAAQAGRLGPLDTVVDQALRRALDPREDERRARWAEDHALLIEAADGAEEALHR